MDNATKTALRFVSAINAHDVNAIMALTAPDHRFVDAWGGREDRHDMQSGWPGYFAWFPDYKIEIGQTMHTAGVVALLGFASGTFHDSEGKPGGHWRLPASWRVVVENGLVKVWQVYCDQKVILDTMVDRPSPYTQT